MSSDEPANAAPAAAAQDTAPAAAPARKHWSTAELWMLGVFSAMGLIGLIPRPSSSWSCVRQARRYSGR